MTGLAALRSECRRRIDDDRLPYQVSDVQLNGFASEAEREACQRAFLIVDQTSTFTTLAVTENTARYALDDLILTEGTIHATFTPTSGRARQLTRRGEDWIREQDEFGTRTGKPTDFAITGRELILWPTPSETYEGTLQLRVFRLPLDPLSGNAEPEIPVQYHDALVGWMVYRACLRKDSEVYNPDLAAAGLTEFEAVFGQKRSANAKRQHAERTRRTSRYGGL